MKKINKKGFTIAELAIVIAVIAILAAVMIPTFGNIIKNANQSAALQEATNLYKTLLMEEEITVKNASNGSEKIKINGDLDFYENEGVDLYIKISQAGDYYYFEVKNGKISEIALTGDPKIEDNYHQIETEGYTNVFIYYTE